MARPKLEAPRPGRVSGGVGGTFAHTIMAIRLVSFQFRAESVPPLRVGSEAARPQAAPAGGVSPSAPPATILRTRKGHLEDLRAALISEMNKLS
jgi:hypothetical protein